MTSAGCGVGWLRRRLAAVRRLAAASAGRGGAGLAAVAPGWLRWRRLTGAGFPMAADRGRGVVGGTELRREHQVASMIEIA